MFYGLTIIALLLAAIVLIQNVRLERRAYKNRLDAIHKQIEENEKHKAEKTHREQSEHSSHTK